jgi:hypothetical protein
MRGNLEVFIPIVALIVAWAIAFIALYFRNRAHAFRHSERMAAIEKGIDLPPEATPGRNAYLLRGLIWLFVGAGIGLFFLVLLLVTKTPELLAMATIGLIPGGVGIAYLVVYRTESKPGAVR